MLSRMLLGADRITAPPFHWCEANAATHFAQANTHTFHDPTGWLEHSREWIACFVDVEGAWGWRAVLIAKKKG